MMSCIPTNDCRCWVCCEWPSSVLMLWDYVVRVKGAISLEMGHRHCCIFLFVGIRFYSKCWVWDRIIKPAGPRFNIKMTSYRYRKSHCGDKTVVRSSYLHNGISYTGKMKSLYWIRALVLKLENLRSTRLISWLLMIWWYKTRSLGVISV